MKPDKPYKTRFARLDVLGQAKPLTAINIHLDPHHCFYGVKPYHNPEWVDSETGEVIPLFENKP